MTTETEWTVLRLLQWTTQFLRDRGSQTPRLDAEVLLAHCRGTSRLELYTAFEELANDALRTQFRELVRKRAEGCPVAYLVGSREFFSRSFRVSEEVLIPRPETEYVMTALLDAVKADGRLSDSVQIVDVGTGSGILAITACLELPQARVTAIDVEAGALQIARQNAADHGVVDRIEFLQGDLLSTLPATRSTDYILSNPPYISESEFSQLPRDVREYEPRAALLAGINGTAVIERLIPQAADRLISNGRLIFEISPMIEADALACLADESVWNRRTTIRDTAQLARVIVSRRT